MRPSRFSSVNNGSIGMIRLVCSIVASLALVIHPIASWGACLGCGCGDPDRGGCCQSSCDAGCCGAETSGLTAACLPANGQNCCSALSPPASSLQSQASHLKPPESGCQSCANQCACSIDRGSEAAVWTTPLLPPELALTAVTAWDGPTDSADGILLDRQRPVPTRGNRLQSWLCVWVI